MIPISERLPSAEDLDQYECVLVQLECGAFHVANFDEDDVIPFYNQDDYFSNYDVVSWCRLPSADQDDAVSWCFPLSK